MSRDQQSSARSLLWFAVVLLLIGAAAGGVYLADRLYYEPLREQQRMVANLKGIVEKLTRDVRVAQVVVLEQTPAKTTFRFQEIDTDEKPLGAAKDFTIDGDIAYFDTLVIKFEDSYLPLNDAKLKSKELSDEFSKRALIVFRRTFGEKQKPEDGFPLDAPGGIPSVYAGGGTPSGLELQLWQDFWKLANDPQLAKQRGVRAAHGQAVYTQLMKNKYYVLERRLSGDLSIRPVDVPAVLRR